MDALITGRRVFLRHPGPGDEGEYVALRRASRELLAPWEPIPEDGSDPNGPEAFARLVAQANTDRHQKHLVCLVEDGAICGAINLNEIVRGCFRSAFLGYWTGLPHLRRGYAREAVELAASRAFTALGLHRLEANIVPGNVASIAVVKRCGFRQEGYSPGYLKIAGRWQDHERWALTLEDFEAARSLQTPVSSDK